MNLDGFALPIKKLKGTDPVDSLDFYKKSLGPASAVVIGSLIRDNASLTECYVRGNRLNTDSATMLAKVATEKRVMLFGIKHDQKKADFYGARLGPVDAILIANDLTVSASLTEVCAASAPLPTLLVATYLQVAMRHR